MLKPKVVLFDFGGTLVDDTPCDIGQGIDYIRRLAINPDDTTTAELCELWAEYYAAIKQAGNPACPFSIETPLSCIFRYIFSASGLKYEKNMAELEYLFDKHNSERKRQPYMTELLSVLKQRGIRTAVISNIVLSGESLRRAIEEQYPDGEFEYVLTSADYCLLKPAPFMFRAAARVLGVECEECIYCGDSFAADVTGAGAAGMGRVLYDVKSAVPYDDSEGYIRINSWRVLADLFKGGE